MPGNDIKTYLEENNMVCNMPPNMYGAEVTIEVQELNTSKKTRYMSMKNKWNHPR